MCFVQCFLICRSMFLHLPFFSPLYLCIFLFFFLCSLWLYYILKNTKSQLQNYYNYITIVLQYHTNVRLIFYYYTHLSCKSKHPFASYYIRHSILSCFLFRYIAILFLLFLLLQLILIYWPINTALPYM